MAKTEKLKTDGSKIAEVGKKILTMLNSKETNEKLKEFKNIGNKVLTTGVKLADPTGVSNYGDLVKAVKSGNKGEMVIEGIASLPMVGKVGKVIKTAETAFKGVKTGIKPIQTIRRVMQGISEAKDYLPKQKMKNTKMPYTTMPKTPIKPTPLKNK